MNTNFERLFEPLEDQATDKKKEKSPKKESIFSDSSTEIYTPKQTNKVATILEILSFIIFLIGFVVGIHAATVAKSYGVLFITWFDYFTKGMTFYGLATILNLLQDLVNKSKRT